MNSNYGQQQYGNNPQNNQMYSNQGQVAFPQPNNNYQNVNPQMNYNMNNVQMNQPVMRGIPGCKKCGGSGMKMKKGISKPCKKCAKHAHHQNVGMNVQGGGAYPVHHQHKRFWCGCLKIDKKGKHKCKVGQCNIL